LICKKKEGTMTPFYLRGSMTTNQNETKEKEGIRKITV